MDERQRHAVQHERERSHLEPLLPARRNAPGEQEAGPPQRPCEHVAVVERYVSYGDVDRGRGEREGAAHAGARGPARRIEEKARAWEEIVKIGRTHMQDARRSRWARNGPAMRDAQR